MPDDLTSTGSNRLRSNSDDANPRVSRMMPRVAPPPEKPRLIPILVILVLSLGLAAVWSLIARRQLNAAVAAERADHLVHAQKAFETVRTRNQDSLRTLCRVMVEDPRIKATLGTAGMDEATVADILTDLGKLRRTGFLIVLSPEGRVFAQAGADELRGLDLSESSVVKSARASSEVVVGSWMIGGQIMDLSVRAVRFDTQILAYLAVGKSVDQEVLKVVAEETGVDVATVNGSTVVLTSASDDTTRTALAAIATEDATFAGRVMEIDGTTYVASVTDLEQAQTGQSHPRLVLVERLQVGAFATVKWLMLVPLALVLVAVMFSMAALRLLGARH